MPLGVFVPARLNDLGVDVNVGTPARGALFYRGASVWNALAPGTAGQVLRTNGAGADPSWVTPATGVTDHGALTGLTGTDHHPQYVHNAPGSSTRNVITPPGNFTALTVVGAAGSNRGLVVQAGSGQTGNPFHVMNAAGTASWFEIEQVGRVHVIAGSSNTRFMVAPSGTARLTNTEAYILCSNQSNKALVIRSSLSQVANLSEWQDGSGNTRIIFTVTGSGAQIRVQAGTVQTIDLQQWQNSAGSVLFAISKDGDLNFYRDSSTSTQRQAGDIAVTWATATDATRAARIIHNVWDTAAREALRLEASGTAAMVGFLGAAAVTRRALGAAAVDAATTQALTNTIRQALIDLGLGQA